MTSPNTQAFLNLNRGNGATYHVKQPAGYIGEYRHPVRNIQDALIFSRDGAIRAAAEINSRLGANHSDDVYAYPVMLTTTGKVRRISHVNGVVAVAERRRVR